MNTLTDKEIKDALENNQKQCDEVIKNNSFADNEQFKKENHITADEYTHILMWKNTQGVPLRKCVNVKSEEELQSIIDKENSMLNLINPSMQFKFISAEKV
jgi:hypothetical protein